MSHPTTFVSAIFALLTITGGVHSAAAQQVDDVMSRLRQKYESVAGLQAKFRQTMSADYMLQPEISTGTVLLSGDRFRVETNGQTLVNNGVSTWMYDVENAQLVINDNIDDETTFSISDFLFNYEKDYEPESVRTESVNGEPIFVISLRPRDKNAFYRSLSLHVRNRDSTITRLEITDANETHLKFELDNIVLNPPIGTDAFTFSPPQGTEVIDLRS